MSFSEEEYLNKTKLFNKLVELNKQVLSMSNEILSKKREIDEGWLRHNNELVLLNGRIASEKDKDNKIIYSNEDKRKARLLEILSTGHPLATLRKQLEDDEFSVKFKLNELEFLKREFEICLKVL